MTHPNLQTLYNIASAKVGEEQIVDHWLHIDQEKINQFAEATLDHQFIHVDPEKAKLTPWKGTIAHGYLTLSLMTYFLDQVEPIEFGLTPAMVVNYGLEKTRFLQAIKVNSFIRARFTLQKVMQKEAQHGLLLHYKCIIDIQGEKKSAMIANVLMLVIFDRTDIDN